MELLQKFSSQEMPGAIFVLYTFMDAEHNRLSEEFWIVFTV